MRRLSILAVLLFALTFVSTPLLAGETHSCTTTEKSCCKKDAACCKEAENSCCKTAADGKHTCAKKHECCK